MNSRKKINPLKAIPISLSQGERRLTEKKFTSPGLKILYVFFGIILIAGLVTSVGSGVITTNIIKTDIIQDNGQEINVTSPLNFYGPNGWPSVVNNVDVGGRTHLFFDDGNGTHRADISTHDPDPADNQSRLSIYTVSSNGTLQGGLDFAIRSDTTNISFRTLGPGGFLDMGRNSLLQPYDIQSIGAGTANGRLNITSVSAGPLFRTGGSFTYAFDDGATAYLNLGKSSANFTGSSTYDVYVSRTLNTTNLNSTNSYVGNIRYGSPAVMTLSSGSGAKTQTYMAVETQGAIALDNMTKITGGVEGDVVILRLNNTNRKVTLVDNTTGVNTFRLAGGDFNLTHVNDVVELIYANGAWIELARNDND